MSYERKQIPAMIDALEAAKKYLWSGVGPEKPPLEMFICHCLEKVERRGGRAGNGAHHAISVIEDAIRPCSTLESWLEQNGCVKNMLINDRLMQRLRRKWIDKMIADLKRFADDAG